MSEQEPTSCYLCGAVGGRFRWVGDGRWACASNCAARGTRNTALSTFPFTSTNIDGTGRPIEVQSLRHMRALEREHGVYSTAYNNDASNH